MKNLLKTSDYFENTLTHMNIIRYPLIACSYQFKTEERIQNRKKTRKPETKTKKHKKQNQENTKKYHSKVIGGRETCTVDVLFLLSAHR